MIPKCETNYDYEVYVSFNDNISNIRIDGDFFLFKNKLREYIVGMTLER